MPETFTVSTASELEDALGRAAGGDTILLESGRYGGVDIRDKNYSDFVTIRSADGDRGAVFDSLEIDASSYVRVESVHVDNPTNGSAASRIVTVDDGSSHIEFLDSEVNGKIDGNYDGHYGIHTGNASNVRIGGNYVHDIKHGGVFLGTNDIEVVNNTFDHLRSDSMKFAGNNGVLIENNTGARTIYKGDGDHVDFIQFQGSSSNIVIRGNVSLPEVNQSSQGIFLATSGNSYDNVLIENNIIYNELVRGITVGAGSNVTIQQNTLLTVPDSGHKGSYVFAPDDATVTNNVVSGSSGGSIGPNRVEAQYNDPNGTA